MSSRLAEIFEDANLVKKIKRRLPYLFQIAGLESSRAGGAGMAVGLARESIIIGLLIYRFGEADIQTEIPITEPEVDVMLCGQPISIKTITSKGFGGVKISWTVDAQVAEQFAESYRPSCDILFAQINWNDVGGFYYIPQDAQKELLNEIGARGYIKLPKPGTNPRGIEITKEALSALVQDSRSRRIMIDWKKIEIDFSPYKRWVDLWKEE